MYSSSCYKHEITTAALTEHYQQAASRLRKSQEKVPHTQLLLLSLLLHSHKIIATMQPVVTEQATVTLERKITSGGKQAKQKIILAHTKTETTRIP